MKLHYSLPSKLILDPARAPGILKMLRDAGVDKMWLWGYFFGHMDAPPAKLNDARAMLEQQGFEVGLISLPVGHPGNSIDPEDPTCDVRIPSHWRYRVDRHGRKEYHCGDIEEKMIRDNVEAMQLVKDAGFTDVFLDDDFRMGNHGPEVTGCFCDACILAFNAAYHRTETRESIGAAIARRDQSKLIDDWTEYICGKVTRLAKALALPGINLGIMVMHRGDDRHGIRIADWKPHVKLMRVGEAHFDDRDFGPPQRKASEIAGMQLHISRMQPTEVYSETTGFPPRKLSAANWVFKAKLAAALGIPNIFLMGGTWLLDPAYWQALSTSLPGLREVERVVGDLMHPRAAPVHVAIGKSDWELPWWPLRAGLPARPVLATDAGDDGEVLVVLGTTRLGPEWSSRLHRYKRVVFDATAAVVNKPLIKGNATFRVLDRSPAWLLKLAGIRSSGSRDVVLATRLRQELEAVHDAIPRIDNGMDIFLAWIPDKHAVVACNLRAEPNACQLKVGQQRLDIMLDNLEMIAIKIENGGLVIVARA